MVVFLFVLAAVAIVLLVLWMVHLFRQGRDGDGRGGRRGKSRRGARAERGKGAGDSIPSSEVPVVDIDQLTAWVLAHLPSGVTGTLDSDDIHRIVEWNLDFVRSKRASTNGHSTKPATQVIVAGAETAEYILRQASANGLPYTPEQVHAVLDAQMAFLESIGAAGPEIKGE